MAISIYLSIITWNVNGLNAPIKRHMIANELKKKPKFIYVLPARDLRSKDINKPIERGWKKLFHANRKESWSSNTNIKQNRFYLFIFLSFCIFGATHGGSQARGQIRAIATSLCQSHCNAWSKLCLQPTPQLTATLDP